MTILSRPQCANTKATYLTFVSVLAVPLQFHSTQQLPSAAKAMCSCPLEEGDLYCGSICRLTAYWQGCGYANVMRDGSFPQEMREALISKISWIFNYYCVEFIWLHYSDVIIGVMASQITSLTICYSTVYSGADQWKHQSSASPAFVRGIHRRPVNTPHKWPVTRKCFHLITSSWTQLLQKAEIPQL